MPTSATFRPLVARLVAVGLAAAAVFVSMSAPRGTDGGTDGPVMLRIQLAADEEFVPADGSGTFVVGGTVDGLYPGGQLQLPLTITNPNAFAITVKDITATPTSDAAGCPASNLSLGSLASAVTVPANSTATTQIPVSLLSSAGDACQGATFTLAFSGNADTANPPTPTTTTTTTTTTVATTTVATTTTLATTTTTVRPTPTTQAPSSQVLGTFVTTPAPAPTSRLSRTGSDTDRIVIAGALLLVSGAVLGFFGRRRPSTSSDR